jgi:hypothetical protein
MDGPGLNQPKNRMDFLMEFLRQEVQNEERISLAKSGFDMMGEKKSKSKSKNWGEVRNRPIEARIGHRQRRVG